MVCAPVLDARVASGQYNANTGSNTAGTSFSFTSVSIGATGPGARYVLVGMAAQGATASPTSITVGGFAATALVQAANGNNRTELWLAYVPSSAGTTATIVVTYAASTTRCAVGSWTIYDLSSEAAYATATATTTTMTLSVNVPTQGVVVGLAFSSNSAPDATWVGATENFDTDSFGSGGGRAVSGALATGTTAGAPRTVTCTVTGASGPVGCAVALC